MPSPSAAILLLCLAGCGEAYDSGVELASAVPGRCAVSGEAVELSDLLVTAANGDEFLVDLRAVPATVRVPELGEPTDPVRMSVEGALLFDAHLAMARYTVAADVETENGMVRIAPGAQLAWARATGAGVVGTLIAGGATGDETQLGPLSVPCAALSLDPLDGWLDADRLALGDGTQWVLRAAAGAAALEDDGSEAESFDEEAVAWALGIDDDGDAAVAADDPRWAMAAFERQILSGEPAALPERLTLQEYPGGGRSVTLADHSITVERVSEDGAWMQVVATTTPGDVIGWVPRDELRQVEWLVGTSFGRGVSICGCCGCGFGGVPTYRGPAEITAGATVFADTSRDSAWATVAATQTFEIHHARDSDWVTLERVPGISSGCGRLGYAHVPRLAVTLPEGAEYR